MYSRSVTGPGGNGIRQSVLNADGVYARMYHDEDLVGSSGKDTLYGNEARVEPELPGWAKDTHLQNTEFAVTMTA